MKKKDIATAIKVSPSTISRELKRNSGRRGGYNWETAQKNAFYHKHCCPGNRSVGQDVKEKAISLLKEEQWSPEQISGSLAKEGLSISHETIYAIIRKDKRQGGDLYKNCRHQLKHRARPVGGRLSSIPNRVSIDERPKEADGKRFGDFEMDTIVGKNNHGAIVTIIERSTNMLFMRKLNKGKDAKALAEVVIHLLKPFKNFIKTITTDNGTEFACHERISQALEAPVYFADPYSSWQKGGIENENGLIRQYIPKSTKMENVSHQDVNRIMHKINRRPREKLNFDTPIECFYEKFSQICTCYLNSRFDFLDQDAINVLFRESTLELPYCYNVQNMFYMKDKEKALHWSKWGRIAEAKSHPVVMHFCSSVKPWQRESLHPKRELFLDYLNRSPWKNNKIESCLDGRSLKYKIFYYLVNKHILPGYIEEYE